MSKKVVFATGIVAFLFIIGCGVGSSTEPTASDNKRLDNQANGTVNPSSKPVAAKQIIAGDWKVGTKENIDAGTITPGTYVVTSPDDGIGCYWRRVKAFDGEFNSIIANGLVDPGKTSRVVVKATDKGLSLEHDCLAKKEK